MSQTFGFGAGSCIGCKICRTPLDANIPIIKGSTTTSRSGSTSSNPPIRKKFAARPRDLQPVASKCGHIFHRGCVRNIINKTASSKVTCPVCQKPFTFAQLQIVRFYYPRNKAGGIMNIGSKIRQINQNNLDLHKKLNKNRKCYKERKEQLATLLAQVEDEKNEKDYIEKEIQRKRNELHAMTLDGLNVKDFSSSSVTTRNRILEISHKNAMILKNLELRVSEISGDEGRRTNLNWLEGIQAMFSTPQNKKEKSPNLPKVGDCAQDSDAAGEPKCTIDIETATAVVLHSTNTEGKDSKNQQNDLLQVVSHPHSAVSYASYKNENVNPNPSKQPAMSVVTSSLRRKEAEVGGSVNLNNVSQKRRNEYLFSFLVQKDMVSEQLSSHKKPNIPVLGMSNNISEIPPIACGCGTNTEESRLLRLGTAANKLTARKVFVNRNHNKKRLIGTHKVKTKNQKYKWVN